MDHLADGWRRIHPGAEVDVLSITLRVIRAGRILEAKLEAIASSHGLAAPGDYEVLSALRRSHPAGLQPAGLAERLIVTTSGMTGRLDRLEGAGLVERRRHPRDRRAIEVFITDEGISTADSVFKDRLAEESSVLENMSRRDQERLAARLQDLLTRLGDHQTRRTPPRSET